jgi:hypothetical protein
MKKKDEKKVEKKKVEKKVEEAAKLDKKMDSKADDNVVVKPPFFGTWESFMMNAWWNLKRTWVDALILVGILAAIFFLPAPETGLISLAIGKLMFVSAGIFHAHVTRKLMWPYIDFNGKDTDVWQKVMVVVWYAVIIWSWARGG